MRPLRHSILLMLSCLYLAACSSSPLENKQGIAISAYFSDDEDKGTDLTLLGLWFYDSSNGKLVHQSEWNDSRDLASTFFSLPQGSYLVVLGANIDSPLSVDGEDASNTLSYSLGEASPRKVFSACAELYKYSPSRIENLTLNMGRITPELTIDIQDAPQGLEFEMEAVNCASSFYPAEKDARGIWGRPSDAVRSITFDRQCVLLMPTASGRDWSFFHLTIRTREGAVLESYIEAPRMEAGERYLMQFKYDEIESFMHLSSCPIGDWTEGWVYEGDVTDPAN